MGGRRGIPMSERVRQAPTTYDDCPARHCWVADALDGHGVKRPGLAGARPGRWVLVEEWVAAALLTPS